MKKEFKIYLEPESIEKLRIKAEQMGFYGRGAISHYIQKISNESIVFLDANTKTMLKSLDLK